MLIVVINNFIFQLKTDNALGMRIIKIEEKNKTFLNIKSLNKKYVLGY